MADVDNSSYRSQYLEYTQAEAERKNLHPESLRYVVRLWKRIKNAESEIGKTLEDGYAREDYIALFEKMRITNVNGFNGLKSRINNYLDWLLQRGIISSDCIAQMKDIYFEDIESVKIFGDLFFPDFDALQNSLNENVRNAYKPDDTVFAMQISLIYMAWCGVDMEVALKVKKEDVNDDFFIAGGEEFRPNYTIMQYLKEYRDAVEYISQGKYQLTLKYVPSDYLFRSVRSETIDMKHAIIALNRFGKSGSNGGNPYKYDKIYWSGTFHRAYLYELANGEIQNDDIETMNRLFHGESQDGWYIRRRLREYKKFKEYFFTKS